MQFYLLVFKMIIIFIVIFSSSEIDVKAYKVHVSFLQFKMLNPAVMYHTGTCV